MPDITIPDAAVEAAARADYYNVMVEVEVPFEVYENREWWLNNSRIALAAAAPHIAAQALEDLLTDAPPTGRVPHPFHSWREWIAYRALRLREPIEADRG